jgi:hypothetical protein
MKKLLLFALAILAISTISLNVANAQSKTKKVVESKGVALSAKDAAKYVAPVNKKGAEGAKTRGDIYGSNYSDIVVNNYTGYYIEIYVDGTYRTTVSPKSKVTTWAIPGKTRLVGIARFPDGDYTSWGPINPVTGYQYTWNLYN